MLITKIKGLYTNNSKLFNNLFGSYLVKGGSIIIGLFTMPAYMRYFSDQTVLGMWFTVYALISWILTFDLGIGNGLRHKLVPALVSQDKASIKKYISSAYILIGILSFFTMIIGVILIRFGDWNSILKVSNEAISSDVLKTAVILIFIGIIFQFFLRLISSVLFAMQKTAISNFISLMGTTVILIYVSFFGTGDAETDLLNLAKINLVNINVPLIVATLIVFSASLRKSRPSIKGYEKEAALSVISIGGKFFFIQIMLLFINSTDQILITQFFGPEYVVQYQVYFRIFYFSVSIFSLIANPIWSAVADAYAKKRYEWIIRTNWVLVVVALVVSSGNLLLVVFSQPLVNLWLGDKAIEINFLYAAVFAIFSSVTMLNMAFSAIANGCGKLKAQIVCNLVASILKIPIVFALIQIIDSWIVVVVVNTIIILPYTIVQPRIMINFLRKIQLSKESAELPKKSNVVIEKNQ